MRRASPHTGSGSAAAECRRSGATRTNRPQVIATRSCPIAPGQRVRPLGPILDGDAGAGQHEPPTADLGIPMAPAGGNVPLWDGAHGVHAWLAIAGQQHMRDHVAPIPGPSACERPAAAIAGTSGKALSAKVAMPRLTASFAQPQPPPAATGQPARRLSRQATSPKHQSGNLYHFVKRSDTVGEVGSLTWAATLDRVSVWRPFHVASPAAVHPACAR